MVLGEHFPRPTGLRKPGSPGATRILCHQRFCRSFPHLFQQGSERHYSARGCVTGRDHSGAELPFSIPAPGARHYTPQCRSGQRVQLFCRIHSGWRPNDGVALPGIPQTLTVPAWPNDCRLGSHTRNQLCRACIARTSATKLGQVSASGLVCGALPADAWEGQSVISNSGKSGTDERGVFCAGRCCCLCRQLSQVLQTYSGKCRCSSW